MKKFIRHFVSFFLVAVMIVSSNITAFAANEKPVDSRFLPEKIIHLQQEFLI